MVFHRRHRDLCEYPIFSPYPCLYFLSLPIDQRKGFSGRQGEGNSLVHSRRSFVYFIPLIFSSQFLAQLFHACGIGARVLCAALSHLDGKGIQLFLHLHLSKRFSI